MKELDAEIRDLFKEQSGIYPNENEYRAQLNRIVSELFLRQPKNVNLPEPAFQSIVVSLLRDYKLSLDEVRQRISARR